MCGYENIQKKRLNSRSEISKVSESREEAVKKLVSVGKVVSASEKIHSKEVFHVVFSG